MPFPPPGDLPDPGIESTSPALAGGFFTTEPPRNQYLMILWQTNMSKHKSLQNNFLLELYLGFWGLLIATIFFIYIILQFSSVQLLSHV